MHDIIWLVVLTGTLFVAGAYAQTLPTDDGTTADALTEKFDAGFYQKIQDMIESDRTGQQDPSQKIQDSAGPRGASDTHDGERHYNVIIVVGRDGNNPDEAARQNKKSIVRHLESLGARDVVAAESLSFVTASIPVSEIPGLSLREEVRKMGDGELPVTTLADRSRQTIHAAPSDLRQSTGIMPNGTGVVVAVIDDGGINSPHLNDKVADRVSCNSDGCWPRSGSGSSTAASHGTRVAGVLAASDMRSNNGIAPGVTLLDAVHGNSPIGVMHALDWSYSRGADVSSHSFGFSSWCDEDRGTMSATMIMNEAINRGITVVDAAGNGGGILGIHDQTYQTIGLFPCVHNTIAVGGINDRSSEITMFTKSSRGPTFNSNPRLAPHIVAPAVGIGTLTNTVDDTISAYSGTSFAAPQGSAAAAILLQVSPELTTAGVRAALLLGANWTGPIPCTSAQYEQNNTDDPCSFAMQPADSATANNASSLKILNNVGFGILNVAGSLGYANSSSLHIISDHLDATTGTRTYELDVTDASVPVKVILTWMVPGQSLTDLNLEITTPTGSTINASSVHQTTEFAVFNPNVTGTYTVTVRGSGFGLSDRPVQTFALAGTSGLAAVLPPDPPPAAPLAIDAVGSLSDDQLLVDHETWRHDLKTTGGAGPVTWSIDEKPGARIHPDTGHLVYFPTPGTERRQTITVRADDGNSSVPIDIDFYVDTRGRTIESVRPSSQNQTVLNATYTPSGDSTYRASFGAFSDGAFTLRSDVLLIWRNASTQNFLSYPYDLPPQPDQLHIFKIGISGQDTHGDIDLYAQVTPGKAGHTMIPNPFTRPDPFAPSFDHVLSGGTPEAIRPGLVSFDGDRLTITDAATDGGGTVTPDGTTIHYTPEAGAAGTDTITYTVTDNRGRTGTGTINLFRPITVNDDAFRTDEDTPVNIDVLANDTASGVELTASDPPNGTATVIQSNTTITYDPRRNYHGPDSFTYTVTDDAGSTATGTVRITVTPVNDLPAISGLENMTISELIRLDIPVAVTDADNATDQLTLTTTFMGKPGLPEGMQMTREHLAWTPTESQGPGTYPFTVSIDDGLNQTTRGFMFTVNEANQDPEFNITSTDHTATQGIEFTLNMNASDADLPEQEITCSITSQETGIVPAQINPQTCIITWTPADLGDHVIRVQAQDNLGGATPITAININVRFNDVQVPVITLNNATQNPQIIELGDEYEELDATVRDDDPDYDGGAVPDTSGLDLNNADNYTVIYHAPADASGKKPENVTRTVQVRDTTKPTITITGQATITVEKGSTYSDDGATVTDNDPDYSEDASVQGSNVNTDLVGTYQVVYTAPADEAGNVPDTATRTVIVRDTTAPTITLNGTDPLPHELATPYTDPGADADDGSTVTADTSAVNVNEGADYIVRYTATDDDGNTGTATRTVQVRDTTKPVIKINGISNRTVDYGGMYDDRGANVTDNDPDYTGTVTAGIPEMDSNIEGATYTVTYSAPADDAGNVPDVVTRTVVIGPEFAKDNVDPIAQNATLEIEEDSGESTVRPGISDPDMSGTLEIVSVYTPSKGNIVEFNATTITYAPHENQYGLDSFDYTIQDNRLGNATGTIHVSIEPVNDPPELQTIDDIALDELVLRTITLNATDVDNATESLVWTHTGAPAGLDIAGNLLTWEPTEAQGPGDHPFVITVSDSIDTVSQQVTFTVNEVNQDPVLHQGDVTATRDVLRQFQINATDSDIPRQTLTYRFETGSTVPTGANMSDTGHFSWTPAKEHSGERHVIAITVDDGAGGRTRGSFAIRVDGVGDPPAPGNIIVPGNDNTVIAPASNTTIGRILEAYMSRGLVVYAGDPQPGLAGSSGAGFLLAGIIINGTYADSAGPADWNVTDPDDIAVFVREINNVPPILSEIGGYTINALDTLTFSVDATDFNDTVSYMLSGAPNGAEISGHGGFSWTPGSADIDTHTFAITAHDGQNATDTESVTVRVLPAGTPNESPIAPDVAAAVSPNDRVIIIPAISDPDGDPVRITGATGDAGDTMVSSDNSIEYIAGPNPGIETVAYTVADSRGASVTGTITITIR